MKFFVLHHTPAKDRKEKLLRDFEHHKMDVEWIDYFAPDSATFDVAVQALPPQLKKSHLLRGEKVAMSNPEVSLYYKHLCALNRALNLKGSNVVVFEDDVVLPDNWNMLEYFEKIFVEFEQMEGDFLNIGTAFNMNPSKIVENQLVYHEPHFNTRCAHAYAIAPKVRETFYNELVVVDDALDWKFNDIIAKHGLKSCYVHPGLEQGSLEGACKSLLR